MVTALLGWAGVVPGGLAEAPAGVPAASASAEYRPDRILIMPRERADAGALASFHASQKATVLGAFAGIGGLQVLHLPEGETVPDAIGKYARSGLVGFAEPDYARQLALTPNDPKYADGTLWGLNNCGQSGGIVDADIDGPEAWDVLTSASNIVVAVLDTGVHHTHEDLATNIWINPLDGSPGWNALTGTNNPADGDGHGTLVSGVLGAAGNNGKGVVGVAWRTQIMACKCFNTLGESGFDSDIIECIDYARTNGARIINASFSGTGFSQALSNALYSAREAGIIVVASVGNNAADIDAVPRYPACYALDNVVAVAATTRTDGLWSSSNYGATNADLAAPGAAMYSTFFTADNSYLGGSFLAGTSLAAPYVSGTMALMLTKYPTESHQQIIRRVLDATDSLPALAGKCLTGGRLNLRRALSPPIQLTILSKPTNEPFQLRVSAGPNRTCVVETSATLTNWTPVLTNVTSTDGVFEHVDLDSTNAGRRFYRAVSTP